MIDFEDAITELERALPEFCRENSFNPHSAFLWEDDPITYPIYGYLGSLIGDLITERNDNELLRRCFAFVELLIAEGSQEIHYLVQDFTWDALGQEILEGAREFWGSETTKFFARMAEQER